MEDQPEVTELEGLLTLFEKREQLYLMLTERIVERLGPTVLNALYDFFEVGYDGVSWLDFQLSNDTLIIAAIVSYSADQHVPAVVEKLAPIGPPPPGRKIAEIKRMMRIGIPVDLALEPKETILQFLKEQTEKQSAPDEPLETIEIEQPKNIVNVGNQEFDSSSLTREQIDQALYFQHTTKGTKH